MPRNQIARALRLVQTNLVLGEHGCLCVVKRCSFSVGAIPTRQRSLQPVAIGAAVEVTKPSKPSRKHAVRRRGE